MYVGPHTQMSDRSPRAPKSLPKPYRESTNTPTLAAPNLLLRWCKWDISVSYYSLISPTKQKNKNIRNQSHLSLVHPPFGVHLLYKKPSCCDSCTLTADVCQVNDIHRHLQTLHKHQPCNDGPLTVPWHTTTFCSNFQLHEEFQKASVGVSCLL